uniref:Uncharacterized protein n=1 Tax=Arundo donax TaxID=35708 RepID=A0A0A9G4M7_ARUDO
MPSSLPSPGPDGLTSPRKPIASSSPPTQR